MLARTISLALILLVALIIAGLGLAIKKEKNKIKKAWHLPNWHFLKFRK